ncbi:MAG: hypothetical protein MUC53_16265 [Candidatus Contendobacter sp.]|nr:hypothetical protein [Candidatus Contendobacter sp.]
MLRDFLFWQPTAPATPRALAETLAPLCRLLRADADDAQFADAYAQTLTYALLLARWSGAVEGMRAQAATIGARNLHAFEVLVGPYAVAHLRLSQRVLAEGGTLPADGAHVYLTDKLEPPTSTPPGHLPLAYPPWIYN